MAAVLVLVDTVVVTLRDAAALEETALDAGRLAEVFVLDVAFLDAGVLDAVALVVEALGFEVFAEVFDAFAAGAFERAFEALALGDAFDTDALDAAALADVVLGGMMGTLPG